MHSIKSLYKSAGQVSGHPDKRIAMSSWAGELGWIYPEVTLSVP